MGIYFYKPKFSRELDPFIRVLLCNVIFAHWKLQTHLLGEIYFSLVIWSVTLTMTFIFCRIKHFCMFALLRFVTFRCFRKVFSCRRNLIPRCLLPVSINCAFQNIQIHQSSWQFIIYNAVALLILAQIDKQLLGQTSVVEINIVTSRHSFHLISPRNSLEDKTSSIPSGDAVIHSGHGVLCMREGQTEWGRV